MVISAKTIGANLTDANLCILDRIKDMLNIAGLKFTRMSKTTIVGNGLIQWEIDVHDGFSFGDVAKAIEKACFSSPFYVRGLDYFPSSHYRITLLVNVNLIKALQREKENQQAQLM